MIMGIPGGGRGWEQLHILASLGLVKKSIFCQHCTCTCLIRRRSGLIWILFSCSGRGSPVPARLSGPQPAESNSNRRLPRCFKSAKLSREVVSLCVFYGFYYVECSEELFGHPHNCTIFKKLSVSLKNNCGMNYAI